MKRFLLLITALLFFSNYLLAQNSMVGDGFGGRGWYKPHNYQVGAYSAYTVCGADSQLYAWGSNDAYELGNGTSVRGSDTPVKVYGMTKVKFYTTGYVSAVVRSNGAACVWGNQYAGFGPIPVNVIDSVKFADGGWGHAVFVRHDSTVWAIGQNSSGQLGNGTTSIDPVTSAVKMPGINNAVRAVAVNGGEGGATIILLSDGTIKVTGSAHLQATSSATPVTLQGLSNIVDIKGNTYSAFALNASGEVFAFGENSQSYTLGLDVPFNIYTPPTKLIFPAGAAKIIALSANNDGYSAFALDSNRNVYAWGYNRYGQLGNGTYVDVRTPQLVATDAIDIFAGENFSYILKSDSTLWATGASGYPGYGDWGSIWMNLPNIQRNVFTQIDPTISPMNLCVPKTFGVVPVKLSSFTCTANGNNAILNWQSAEEINADKYFVEYSKDGSNFQSIAIINANGSNSKYNYIHQQVNGTAFYRLKMMDKDGSLIYSEIRVVKFDNKAGFTIAPNPANDVVYLFTKNNAVIKSIQIISIDGQVVKILNKYNSGQQISISTLAKGTYILKAVYQNNEMEYGRFIKM